MQWLRLVTECAVVIYTDRDCEVYEIFKVREITIFSKFKKLVSEMFEIRDM